MVHMFDADIAAECGVNAAVILQHLCFWIEKNKANNEHFHDGMYWTYCSVKALTEIFYYLSRDKINTALGKLKDAGYILEGNYNADPFSHTKWFTVTEKVAADFGKSNNRFTENPKCNSIIYNKGFNITDNINTYTLGDSVESAEIEGHSEHPSDVDEFFDSVWQLYPRKLGKSAVKKTQRKKLQKVGYDTLKRCIDNFKDYIATHGTQEQYVMYGSTFFNGRYVDWMDDSEIPQAAQQIKDGDWE